jgi:hypothetical protein
VDSIVNVESNGGHDRCNRNGHLLCSGQGTMITAKLTRDGSTYRRVRIEPTLDALWKAAEGLDLPSGGHIAVYTDADGDSCVIRSNEDLAVAVLIAEEAGTVLKVHLVPAEAESECGVFRRGTPCPSLPAASSKASLGPVASSSSSKVSEKDAAALKAKKQDLDVAAQALKSLEEFLDSSKKTFAEDFGGSPLPSKISSKLSTLLEATRAKIERMASSVNWAGKRAVLRKALSRVGAKARKHVTRIFEDAENAVLESLLPDQDSSIEGFSDDDDSSSTSSSSSSSSSSSGRSTSHAAKEESAPGDMDVVFASTTGMDAVESIRARLTALQKSGAVSVDAIKALLKEIYPLESDAQLDTVHRRFSCDGCGVGPIPGVRYKSATVENYDLCGVCEFLRAANSDGGQTFLKIRDPGLAPAAVTVVLHPWQRTGEPASTTPEWRGPWHRHGGRGRCPRGFRHPHGASAPSPFCGAPCHDPPHAGGPPPPHHHHHGCPTHHGGPPHPHHHPWGGHHHRPGGFWETAVKAFSQIVAEPRPSGEEPASDSSTSPLHSDEERQLREAILESVKSAASAASVAGDGRAKKAVREAGAVENLTPVLPGGEIPAEGGGTLSAAYVTGSILVKGGGVITPGCSFVKTWRLKNSGSVGWPVGTRLVHVGEDTPIKGPAEGVTIKGSVSPGEEVVICATFTAPPFAGRYRSFWRLVTPSGDRFGHRVWLDIHVENSNADQVFGTHPVASAPPADSAEHEASAPPAAAAEDPEDTGPSVRPHSGSWTAELEELNNMGFFDDDLSTDLLEQFKGHLSNVVDELVKRSQE